MTTRRKQLVSAASNAVRMSKQVDVDVRCFRTPSHAIVNQNCTRATKWCWYFKRQKHENDSQKDETYKETWQNCTELVGCNAVEIESAYLTGCESIALPAMRNSSHSDRNFLMTYTFDFQTMLVTCDEDGLQTDLCSRPALSKQ